MNPEKAGSCAGRVRFFAAGAAVVVYSVAKSDRMHVGLVAIWTCGAIGKGQCFFHFTQGLVLGLEAVEVGFALGWGERGEGIHDANIIYYLKYTRIFVITSNYKYILIDINY